MLVVVQGPNDRPMCSLYAPIGWLKEDSEAVDSHACLAILRAKLLLIKKGKERLTERLGNICQSHPWIHYLSYSIPQRPRSACAPHEDAHNLWHTYACFSGFGTRPFQADIRSPQSVSSVLCPPPRRLNSTSHAASESVTRVRARSAFSIVVPTSIEGRGAKTIEPSTSVTPRAKDPSTLRSPIIRWLQDIAQIMITTLFVRGKKGPFAYDDEKGHTWHVRPGS